MQDLSESSRSAEQISDAFDEAWAKGDVQALPSLYAPDATVESPLIPHLLPNKRDGVCRGHAEIRALVDAVLKRGARWGSHERPIARGNTMHVEYRRAGPDHDQLDYVDVFQIDGGLIKSLRAYWAGFP